MKKSYLVFLMVTILALVLFVGCDNGSNEPKATATQKPVATESATAEPTVEPTATPIPGPKTYADLNFTDDSEDALPALDGWVYNDVTAMNKSVVKKDNDNNYFTMQGFISFTLDELIEEGYSFAFDAKGANSGELAAAFIRGYSQLTIPVSTNPAGAGYYEADDSGTKFTSTTGIGLWFNATGKLTLFVKTYDSEKTAGIGNIFADLTCTYDATKWNNILITDDNKGTIKYTVNNELIATVEYSDLAGYENQFEGDKFYKKVSIKDATGNVVASTESAFVYELSEIAFGLRTPTLNVDNILVKTLEEPAKTE